MSASSWIAAARPEQAEPLIEDVVQTLLEAGLKVSTGVFQAYMEVELLNDGPSTVILEI